MYSQVTVLRSRLANSKQNVSLSYLLGTHIDVGYHRCTWVAITGYTVHTQVTVLPLKIANSEQKVSYQHPQGTNIDRLT